MRSITRAGTALAAGLLLVAISAAPALACGGLIGPNGAVNLLRTTTFAGYHAGNEHYVTAFEFAGGGGAFGSLTPLPGIPTSVEKGGDWTLQRLRLETEPRKEFALEDRASTAAYAGNVEVLQQVKIDALDITVLKGGGPDVAVWAQEHGFRLSPDAPEVLDFYAQRSPVFLAAVFDGEAARERGQQIGDGTPVHITIPTTNPWVPLRILALGKKAEDQVDADVYLLTDRQPALLPGPRAGLTLAYDQPAQPTLLTDLRGDAGMGWVPESAWLTKLRVNTQASGLAYDLAVDASGAKAPSPVAAGLVLPGAALPLSDGDGLPWPFVWLGMAAVVLGLGVTIVRRRSSSRP